MKSTKQDENRQRSTDIFEYIINYSDNKYEIEVKIQKNDFCQA